MCFFSPATLNLFFIFDFQRFDYDVGGLDFPWFILCGFAEFDCKNVCRSPNVGCFQPLCLQIWFLFFCLLVFVFCPNLPLLFLGLR